MEFNSSLEPLIALVHEDALVAALQDMAYSAMAAIEGLGVNAVESAHAATLYLDSKGPGSE